MSVTKMKTKPTNFTNDVHSILHQPENNLTNNNVNKDKGMDFYSVYTFDRLWLRM